MDKKINAGRTQIVDIHGYSASLLCSDGLNPSGETTVIDMDDLAGDLIPSGFGIEPDRIPDYFYIIPEVDPDADPVGTIKVQLAEQSGDEFFTIAARQLLSNTGGTLPYRIKRVFKTGTSASFSVVW